MSPFGTLGFPSEISTPDSVEVPVDSARYGDQLQRTMASSDNALLEADKTRRPRGFATSGNLATNIVGPSGFGSLSSTIFGTGFSQPLSGGTKLTTFAAPVGDTKWGDQGGSMNLLGTAAKEEEEDNSSSECQAVIDTENEDGSSKVDSRFQQQDGKTHYQLIRYIN